ACGLDAAEVVLVGRGLRVQRVVAGLVAVPDIDRRAREWRAVGAVLEGEADRQGNAGGDTRRRPEARADVLADDAGLGQHVGAVRAVAGEQAGGLLGDDLARRRVGAAGCARALA